MKTPYDARIAELGDMALPASGKKRADIIDKLNAIRQHRDGYIAALQAPEVRAMMEALETYQGAFSIEVLTEAQEQGESALAAYREATGEKEQQYVSKPIREQLEIQRKCWLDGYTAALQSPEVRWLIKALLTYGDCRTQAELAIAAYHKAAGPKAMGYKEQ